MKTNITSLILAIIGQALIITGFMLFRGNTPDNILWLNIVVTSIVFWLIAANFTFIQPVRLDDPAGKHAAGLGIRWGAVIWYAILAIGFMAVAGYLNYQTETISFKWQLMVQAILLFVMVGSLIASQSATDKAGQAYATEQQTMRGKMTIRQALSDLARVAEGTPGIPAEITGQIRHLSDETRYITPSQKTEALYADDRILDLASRLRPVLSAYDMNSQMIASLVSALSSELTERKRVLG